MISDNYKLNHKYKEIKSYFDDFLEENEDLITDDRNFYDDIHHHCFNTDYYIIGTYEAKKWLGDQVLDIIQYIKTYEEFNFGEVSTDFSDAEKIVNMYVYIMGEYIVQDWYTPRSVITKELL